jgi:signal transduction histidine kinase
MKAGVPPRAELDQLLAEIDGLREAVGTLESTLHRYADHYDGAPFGSLTMDESGIIRELNQAACDLLKVGRRQALGKTLEALVRPADRAALATHLRACRTHGVATVQLQLQRADRTTVEVELRSREAGPEERRYLVTAVIALGESPADREREGLLAVAREALDRSAAKTELLAMISHELRAPLMPLLAAVSALEQRAGDSGEVWQLCHIIRRSVNGQVRMIDDLIDTTGISRGKLRLRREPTELHAVVRQAVEQAGSILQAKQIGLAVSLAARRCLVDGDPIRLGQVFTNLLGNAAKFTPPGGSIAVRSWDSDDQVVVEVADTGVGIPPEALSRLFEPFEQVERPEGSQRGLGLGLAISKGIVELHRGRITAASAGPGQGARFVVELPVLRPGLAPQANGHSRARILLVEDDADTAAALILALGTKGYGVDHAESVTAALRADLTGIDLVLSDLRLADGDGRSLLPQLRAGRPITAIALSGYGADDARQASEKAGFFAHLTKPVELTLLTETIERALAEQRKS